MIKGFLGDEPLELKAFCIKGFGDLMLNRVGVAQLETIRFLDLNLDHSITKIQ